MEVIFKPEVIEKIIKITGENTKEIGGYLIGNIDKNNIIIEDALTSKQTSSFTSVILDFNSQIDVLKKVNDEREDQVICGWFHSHPGMGANFMSRIDIKTQNLYQNLFKDSIALIIDPVRYQEKFKIDDRTLKIYRIEKNKPINIDLKLEISQKDILEYFLAYKFNIEKNMEISEEKEIKVKVPLTVEEMNEFRKQTIYTVIGWNLITLTILIIFIYIIFFI